MLIKSKINETYKLTFKLNTTRVFKCKIEFPGQSSRCELFWPEVIILLKKQSRALHNCKLVGSSTKLKNLDVAIFHALSRAKKFFM